MRESSRELRPLDTVSKQLVGRGIKPESRLISQKVDWHIWRFWVGGGQRNMPKLTGLSCKLVQKKLFLIYKEEEATP